MHCSWGLKGNLAVRPPRPASNAVMSSVELDLRQAYATATSILVERRADLDRLAELLTARRAIDEAELASLLGLPARHRRSDHPNSGPQACDGPTRNEKAGNRDVQKTDDGNVRRS
jgi:hypothetical protein